MMYSFERRLAFPTADFANLSKRDGIIRAASVTLPPDAAKAEAYFERALAIARQQEAKSWQLRAVAYLRGAPHP
jgi:hypothetical protein